MSVLTEASSELFRRTPDEIFQTVSGLLEFCRQKRARRSEYSLDLTAGNITYQNLLGLNNDQEQFRAFNDWSFSQACRLSGGSKDTLNRLSLPCAAQALQELAEKRPNPNALALIDGDSQQIVSLNSDRYSRIYDADLVETMLSVTGESFTNPQTGVSKAGTGLYAGEQDCFVFQVSPLGWVEIGQEAFAPGFFVWNSEVGARSLGVKTFWFQKVCNNHIVWDATDVQELRIRHTGDKYEKLAAVRRQLQQLVDKLESGKGKFIATIQAAMQARLGAEQAATILKDAGFASKLAKETLEVAQSKGGLTIFAVVDALTRLSQRAEFVGQRHELDVKAGKLLALPLQ